MYYYFLAFPFGDVTRAAPAKKRGMSQNLSINNPSTNSLGRAADFEGGCQHSEPK